MPNVERNDLDHMIHGSFRKLDFLDIQDAGDLEGRAVILDKDKELKEKTKEIVTNNYQDNDLRDMDVVMATNGILVCDHLLSLCNDVRMLIIGDGCDIASSQDLVFDSMPNLERVEIGCDCFKSVTAFHVQHCHKLRRVFIGDGSFTICTECVIEDNKELLELQFGSTAADDEENEGGEEGNEGGEEGNEGGEEGNEDGEEGNEDGEEENEGGEEGNEGGEEDPTCFQRSTLTLSSDFSSVERNK